ncbi:hypothetical protein PTSG_06239 [Salpingoeca rosetta]|uniref:ADP-ribosylation factor-related protein 1 n=1 Tax=Salpingoeca rosetta (strain ATCC 50818 / BSB-021) TaxID=946362 RepID=F2UCC2_SALR5|nr:uncharacterized protein PTSG_06239 [Salpingoeca rosetta]EGD74229.1 hypothetical protein PTSG_06239 [Salpingoeca rosetta]|eukprot:XP_004993129.1 hypothetical protein PTSG_06239 [Salpingoeca rosetta]
MFTLLSGLWQRWQQRYEYYALIIGLDAAGKTTLLEKIKEIYIAKYPQGGKKVIPTVGLNVAKILLHSIRLVFWDLGGQLDLHELWHNYYREAHGIIYVIDSTDRERLQESKDVFDHVLMTRELEGVPILILCNKQEHPNAMTVQDIKQTLNQSAHKLGLRDCKVQGVSAVSGENVRESVEWLASRMQRNPARPPKLA